MCGLVAILSPGRSPDATLLKTMEQDLFHRGPDSGAVLTGSSWGLAFRRLAIIDPLSASNQPMTSPSAGIALVFNGEIYNYRELRTELTAMGTRFRTSGDTEVILEGFRRWGTDVFRRLEGMFALVLIDEPAGKAYAARDPFGIKPLYMRRTRSNTAFASEMRPLRRLGGLTVDPIALAEQLTYTWAAGRLSNVREIERLPGGTWTEIDLATGALREHRFADPLALPEDGRRDLTPEACYEAVRNSLRQHLVSDVGYTLQLSGGVDSSVIAALARLENGSRLRSFGVRLEDPRYDESVYRDMVVQRYDLEHHEVLISGKDFADALPAAVDAMEGPVPHGGCVMLFLLCREVARYSKVVLTGEGADELFGGYQRYENWRKLARQEQIARLFGPIRPPALPGLLGARQFHRHDAAALATVYQNLDALQSLFPDLLPVAPGAREKASARFDDFRERLLAVDQVAYLESLLVRQDKMSMASSVEARVPFVHWPLARTISRLPLDQRIPGGVTKPILKDLADQLLPRELVHRRKIGLRLPYDVWLADDSRLGRYLPLLTDPDSRLAAYGDGKRLQRVVEDFRRGKRETDGLPRMFQLVNTELWLRSVTI